MREMCQETWSKPPARAVRTRALDNKEELQTNVRSEWKRCFTHEDIRKEHLKYSDVKIVDQWMQNELRSDIKEICLMTQAARHYWHIYH